MSLKRFFRPPKKRKRSYAQEKDRLFGDKKRLPCVYCGKMLARDAATLEHVKPLSAGGYNKPVNYRIACALCNNAKGSMTREAFLNERRH